jgi:hypothetical protein
MRATTVLLGLEQQRPRGTLFEAHCLAREMRLVGVPGLVRQTREVHARRCMTAASARKR